jgi:cellulose synthase/poly-beta-1,6-N-acetylglucosamine synthase-like glycosyltransferase
MRIGTNPKKLNVKKLIHKPHRVIIPVYILNLEEEYFKNALEVLKLSLDSLLATTNPEQTNITIINNNSCNEVDNFLEEYFQKSAIDKYVKRTQNRGKVETILSEALGSYEDFITIADADVLYWPGWLEESMKLFTRFSPGVVMPLPAPNHYAMYNLYCFNKSWLLGKLNWGQVVAKENLI